MSMWRHFNETEGRGVGGGVGWGGVGGGGRGLLPDRECVERKTFPVIWIYMFYKARLTVEPWWIVA